MLAAHARLIRHPDAPWSGPDVSISATCIVRAGGAGECRFEVVGGLDAVVVPGGDAAARVDGLWRHTCFEVFVARCGEPGYLEFNFAPSGAWAAYAFSGYRTPAPPPAVPAPAISTELTAGRLSLCALAGPGSWPAPEQGALEIALAAVIEAKDGELGYFALRHPGTRPDFHDRRGFALTLGHPAAVS
jgi:hypothetical protein